MPTPHATTTASPRLVVADSDGQIRDHPYLRMVGRSGIDVVPVPSEDLLTIPEGSKLFTMPGSHPTAWNPKREAYQTVSRTQVGGRRFSCSTVAAFLPPGYTRTLLPAATYPAPQPPLPLWSYTAVGWNGDGFVATAIRTDPMDHSAARHYDDRQLLPRMQARLKGHGDNPILAQLARCATEYHCLAAKNLFLERWEAPLPVANSCNSACVGCLSWQPTTACASSHQRIRYAPTAEHVVDVALPFLTKVPEAIVSFGQGCEGEPLLLADVIAEAVRRIRATTDRGTINCNTNGSLPRRVEQIAKAGLDSIRISLNSALGQTYTAYYLPRSYRWEDVRATIGLAKASGLYTTLNYLVFPGVTDREEELDAFLGLLRETRADMVQMRNLSIDPELYLRTVPPAHGKCVGIRTVLRTIRREFPHVEIGYFNRPKELFGTRLCETLIF
jgi:pyruvate-formate lyase-activating enzyme